MCKKCREVPMAKKLLSKVVKGSHRSLYLEGQLPNRNIKKVAGLSALKPSAEYLLEKLSSTAGFRCLNLLLLFLDLLLITETVVRTAPGHNAWKLRVFSPPYRSSILCRV